MSSKRSAPPHSSSAETTISVKDPHRVLKISIIESRSERRLILEGKLLAPWAAELRTACEKGRADLQKRELVIDLKT